MLKARQGKEIVLRTANKIGALAECSKIVAERGLNILAMSAWVEGDEAVIRLVTDDTLRTMDVLQKNGFAPEEISVVLVDAAHKPGILRHLTDVLSRENIDLTHLFGSATTDQDVCLVVLNSSDNDRAIVLLNG
ncbi:MAG: hypothetical protein GTO53_06655 [Planctomycetales bacterium]|nr:hypothetical protein [Planctomycetales bacterium]NIM08819.1 hypothetical protein [Planctomycetales bacterium]NIN08278.1 hypothetical protein [Planctomycetales bacterium]NIN77407.1 hypothetical protein [Planctomycetales bacterium]NIO34584.1 hypothetical protein [Planctomycetales bacterium]